MGFDGIIFTVDLAVLGNRELDKRAKLTESGVSLLLRSHHLLSGLTLKVRLLSMEWARSLQPTS